MLVSIIIPTYNRAGRVVEAIRSVQRQTYPEKQIIVIDDGSVDDTRRRVEKLSGVEYHYQNNSRQGAARNTGLKHARGSYIATLDSDDVWEPDFLSESIECLEKHDLDFVFSNCLTSKSSGTVASAWERSGIWKEYSSNPAGEWFLLEPAQVRRLFIDTCPAPSSSLLLRRQSLVAEWNTILKIADDWCLILDMVLSNPCRAAFTMRPLWTKNVHDQNIYDGRSRKEVAAELEIHDTRLMKHRYSTQLTFGERRVFDRRIVKGNLILAAYFAKNMLGIKRSLKFW